jgi:hypothetical protein
VIDRASSCFNSGITLQVARRITLSFLHDEALLRSHGLTAAPGEATRTVSIEIYFRAFGGQFRTGSAAQINHSDRSLPATRTSPPSTASGDTMAQTPQTPANEYNYATRVDKPVLRRTDEIFNLDHIVVAW